MAKPVVRQYNDTDLPSATGVPLRAYRLTQEGELVIDREETVLSARIVGATPVFSDMHQTERQQQELIRAFWHRDTYNKSTVPEHEGKTTESAGRPRTYFEVGITVGSSLSRYI